MKLKNNIYRPLIAILLLATGLNAAQAHESKLSKSENIFEPIAHKPYVEVWKEFKQLCRAYYYTANQEVREDMVKQLLEVKSKQAMWPLMVDYFLAFNEFVKVEPYNPEGLKLLEDVIRRADEQNYLPLRVLPRSFLVSCVSLYHNFTDYEKVFEYAFQLEKILATLSEEDFPEIGEHYYFLGALYYRFKDYEPAVSNYKKAIACQFYAAGVYNVVTFASAFNELGLYYRNVNLDSSDYYFRQIIPAMERSGVFEYFYPSRLPVWYGIVQGNLGYNCYLRGDYERAIPMLTKAVSLASQYLDEHFAQKTSLRLADLYMDQAAMSKAKRWLDSATYFQVKITDEYRIFQAPGANRELLKSYARYYILSGQTNLAAIYLDSAIKQYVYHAESFDNIKQLRAEQKNNANEQIIKDQEIENQQIKLASYRKSLIYLSVILVILIVFGLLFFIFFRRKRAAYQHLVQLSRRWMGQDSLLQASLDQAEIVENGEQKEAETRLDKASREDVDDESVFFEILKEAEQLIQTEELYRNSEFSIDMLAKALNLNKIYLSKAINSVTKKNFSTFVNEYRIKQAVKLLSQENKKELTIDKIAYDVGFNDRVTFYRVFKKIIGISPSEFRKAKQD